MFCKNCGKESDSTKKFCTNCGIAFSATQNKNTATPPPARSVIPSEPWTTKQVLKFLAGITIIGVFIFYKIQNAADSTAIDKNNNALSSFDSGNNSQAISQLQEASNNASSNETKLTTLKNLAYVQVTDSKNEEALSSFQEALKLTSQNSFNYYLISAEIALLQTNPNSAYVNFNKALVIEPDDFQLNNSLAIFYLNLDGSSADYENYPKALAHALKANSATSSPNTLIILGVAYFWNENYDQSISTLSQVNITQHPEAGFWLSYDYIAKGDGAKARSYFHQAKNAGGTPPQDLTDYFNSH